MCQNSSPCTRTIPPCIVMKNNKYVVFFFSGEIKKYINKKEEGVMAS